MAAYLDPASMGRIQPFPTVPVLECQAASVQIYDSPDLDRLVTKKAIYVPELGRTFELGRTLKKAIYGEVVAGSEITLVDPTQPAPAPFRRLDFHVAIKVYNKRKLQNPEVKAEKPENELSAMYLLNHNDQGTIMPLVACCHDETNLYAIMPFLQSVELFDLINDNGPFKSETDAKVFLQQIVTALACMQSVGIAHRDMSLENTLAVVNPTTENALTTARYVVIDFGMALLLADARLDLVPHQGVCGKKAYISPEVLAGHRSIKLLQIDIWALGIMLFMCLTGMPPVDSAVSSDARYRVIVAGRLHDLLQHWGFTHFSPSLVDLLQRMLRATPQERITLQEIIAHPWLQQ